MTKLTKEETGAYQTVFNTLPATTEQQRKITRALYDAVYRVNIPPEEIKALWDEASTAEGMAGSGEITWEATKRDDFDKVARQFAPGTTPILKVLIWQGDKIDALQKWTGCGRVGFNKDHLKKVALLLNPAPISA